jgi:rSAM/selenodomain-associated transferase 2
LAVSVVIPALNEAAILGATIDAAFAAGAAEVIVADGGSTDETIAIATAHRARVVTGERVRARQLNRGAEEAASEAILFLHADTLLPSGACDAVQRAIAQGFDLGGFRIEFLEHCARLSYVAFMINARTRLTRQPWGDQAQFVRREAFVAIGGYPDFPIMEDYELARRMKHRTVLPLTVRTSGRRFLGNGVVRTSAMNWLIIFSYHLGVKPETLARWYRASPKTHTADKT